MTVDPYWSRKHSYFWTVLCVCIPYSTPPEGLIEATGFVCIPQAPIVYAISMSLLKECEDVLWFLSKLVLRVSTEHMFVR
jgi:hypothetical protein